jgi:hypothetical protein
MIEDLVTKEWAACCDDMEIAAAAPAGEGKSAIKPSLLRAPTPSEIMGDEYVEMMTFLEETLYAELRAEEDALLAAIGAPMSSLAVQEQHESDLRGKESAEREEERALETLAEEQARWEAADRAVAPSKFPTACSSSSSCVVLCPMCLKRPLTRARGRVLLCACGFRLDMGPDGATLPEVSARLAETFEAHAGRTRSGGGACTASPRFRIDDTCGGQPLLVANCTDCRFFHVVL